MQCKPNLAIYLELYPGPQLLIHLSSFQDHLPHFVDATQHPLLLEEVPHDLCELVGVQLAIPIRVGAGEEPSNAKVISQDAA